jgi:hypothetical protein
MTRGGPLARAKRTRYAQKPAARADAGGTGAGSRRSFGGWLFNHTSRYESIGTTFFQIIFLKIGGGRQNCKLAGPPRGRALSQFVHI